MATRNKPIKKVCWFFFSLLFGLTLFFLINLLYSWDKKNKITIVTSIYPLYDFCQAIASNFFEIKLLLPSGVSPHHWQPRFSDLIQLEKASALIYIGPNLEPWIADLVKTLKNKNLKLISFEDLCFLVEENNQFDPHIWLDFQLDLEIINRLTQFFSKLAPEVSKEIELKASQYKEKLREIDFFYQKTLSECRQRTIIIDGHEAFNYLARRYELKVVSLHGLNPEADLRSSQVRKLIELIEKEKIKAIFYEAGRKPRLATMLKDKIGAKVLPLYPGHSPAYDNLKKRKSFLELMMENLKNLKEGLECE
ncbi:MAG: zinc ABC transporter substrate-binding protein [Candidatus Aminicenantes bacterium]|nr:zinc ABC transporter substrate-binding protein [Candidatus Aminicenantes bacterium]